MLIKTLEVNKICKKIKKSEILSDVSFDVQLGNITGLIGPNGAGKTTLIRILTGLMRESSGEALVCGKSVRKEFTQAISHVGAIVENPDFYMYLTGKENLKQFARISNKEISDKKIMDSLLKVNMIGHENEKVKTYSLGMRQRLGIAQALIHDPELLIFDEPTNGLDPSGNRELREILRSLAADGKSILVSSHALSELQEMCDDFVVIQKGKIIKQISKAQIEAAQNAGENILFETSDNVQALGVLQKAGIPCELTKAGMIVNVSSVSKLAVASKLEEAGIKVEEMKNQELNLEDKFFEWTEGGAL